MSKDGQYNSDNNVRIDKVQLSLYELKRRCEVSKRIILNPDFQRGDAWRKDSQKSELIESILMGIPIPLFYFFETKYGEMEVVDGRQRITTIIDFINNKFSLTFLKNLSEFNTLHFKDLPPLLRSKIEDYQIMVYIIQPPTPERIKYDIFERVNRAGTQLNNQEIRNALNQGSITKLLKELSELELFKQAIDNKLDVDRMEDREWILRFFYIYLLKIKHFKFDYLYEIEECLTDTMKYFNIEEDLSYLKNLFIDSMSISVTLFKEDGFKFNRDDNLNINLFETLSYLYMILEDKSLDGLKIKIEDTKKEFENMDDFNSKDLKDNNFRFEMIKDLKEEDDF